MSERVVSDEQLAELGRVIAKLDRDEYNQGVPKGVSWWAQRGAGQNWLVIQPTGREDYRIIAEGLREEFAEFIATTHNLLSPLVRALRDARDERDDAQAAVGNVAAIVADRQMEADELRRLLRGAEAELGALRANREALATAWRRLSDRVEDAEARLDRIRRSRAVLGAGPHDYDSFCADVDAALAAPTGQETQNDA